MGQPLQFCRGGGCTAKLGPAALSRVLEKLPRPTDPNLLIGAQSSDDAAVYRLTDDLAIVQTLDFFPPMLDDPYLFGQVAATNALSDIYAMGGEVKTALNIVCTRPKELTRESLKDLRLTLDREGFTTQQLNTAISELTNEEMAADIISLIRRYAIGSTLISHEARIRRAVDKLKKAHKFTAIEQKWIGRMEKYLMEESVLNVGVFDEDTRFRSEGGFKKIDRIFQNKLESIVLELSEYLYDDGGRSA